MPETSYKPDYAPYAAWSVRQAPVPTIVHNVPSSIAASGTVQSSIIASQGFSLIAVGVTASQTGTMSIQRYLDVGGTVVQGGPVTVNLTAATAANLDVMDGKVFAAFKITITNAIASVSNLTNFALLLQASDQVLSNSSADGSATITTGGTSQTLFSSIVPATGYGIYNPDPTNDLWISDTVTAVANGTGCIRVAANGGAYETPIGYRPLGTVRIVGAMTGQKFTARRW